MAARLASGLPQLAPTVRTAVEGLPSALAGKADATHTHPREQATGLDTAQ